jgi:ATP-dependent Clp protease ATP-binding subunit ClpC
VLDNVQRFDRLSPGAQIIVQAVVGRSRGEPGISDWLDVLLERHAAMLERIAADVTPAELRRTAQEHRERGERADVLAVDIVITKAIENALLRGLQRAGERDLAAAVLKAAGYAVPSTGTATAEPVIETVTNAPTPLLDQFGRDLTKDAAAGRISVVVGRDEEIDLIIETICRRTKRNPLLVGPAGVGKTAIVEGLAQRIHEGRVPQLLRNARVIAVQPSSLVAGASIAGELERRVHGILREASQPGVLLFIDEVHSMIGAGGAPGTSDVASLMKPAIARGSLVCIAATTDEEYRTFIERDAALERRFQPIRVQQMTPQQTLLVLRALRDELHGIGRVHVSDELLEWMVDFAGEMLRNRHFPDKAVDLLEQCIAHAVAHSRATLTHDDVNAVVRRMTGMPLAIDERLAAAADKLRTCGCMADSAADALIARLQISMRGLDVRPDRPNAVLLVHDRITAEQIAATLAESLFGDAARVVRIDFGRMQRAHDITMLIGAPPGYVGYSETLAIHRIAQMPFCVLLCDGINSADPAILDFLARCIIDGCITDARGKRIFIRDAIVILATSADAEGARRSVGFHGGDVVDDAPTVQLGALSDQIDVECGVAPAGGAGSRLRQGVLAELAARYRKRGLVLQWDDSFVTWLEQHGTRDVERLLDTEVGPRIAAHLSQVRAGIGTPLVIRYADDTVQVDAAGEEEN